MVPAMPFHRSLLGLSYRLWFALLLMLLFRFALMFGTGPIHDEAYYWSWSQRLDFAYYDQPFLTGWLLAPFVTVLGDHAWVLRAVATTLTFATTLFLALAARGLVLHRRVAGAGGSWRRAEWGFLCLTLTSPVLWSLGLFYTHDTAMLCFLSLGLWLGIEALQRQPDGSSASRWFWIGAGLALGLAFSAKVSASLWIAALGMGVLVHPKGRRHLRHEGPWIAVALITALMAVFVLWNAFNDWVTFKHVGGEHLLVSPTDNPLAAPDTLAQRAQRLALCALALVLFAGLSPMVLGLRRIRGVSGSAAIVALALFAVLPSLFFLGLSWFREIYLNWLIPSALGLMVLGSLYWPGTGLGPGPGTGRATGSATQRQGVANGSTQRWALLGTLPSLALVLLMLVPIGMREPRFMLANARDMLGWKGSLDKLQEYRDQAYPGHVIVGNYYHLAAQTAFHQKRVLPSVGLDLRPHQFSRYSWPEPMVSGSADSDMKSDSESPNETEGPMLVLTPSAAEGRARLAPVYCEIIPISPWPVNHRGERIAEPYLYAISDPRKRPDC